MADKYFGAHEFHERAAEVVDGPSDRKFAVVFAIFCAIVGGSGFFAHSRHWPWWIAAALLFALAGWLRPSLVGPLNWLWLKLGLILYTVISPVVLALVFFLCITPIGFIMRLSGKDPLRLRFDAAAESYWIRREPPGPPAKSFKHQY